MLFFGFSFLMVAFSPGLSTRPRRASGVALLQEKQQISRRFSPQHLRSLDVGPMELLSGAPVAWASDQKLKVVYGVFTSPLPKYAAQMAAVEDTWAKNVAPQKLLVVGVNGSAPGITYKQAPMCLDGHINNPGISCKEATLLATGYGLGADWVVVVGSDNYVFPRNVEERLQSESPDKAQILGIFGCGGGKFCEDHKSGLCGGGGYAISRGALDKMVGKAKDASHKFIQESMITASTVSGYWSDQVTACIARRRGVEEVQLAGLYGWRLCQPGVMSCPFDEAVYRKKILSSSPKSLTFHYIMPNEMHKIHEMVKDARSGNSSGEVFVEESTSPKLSMLLSSSHMENSMYTTERAAYIHMVDEERAIMNMESSV